MRRVTFLIACLMLMAMSWPVARFERSIGKLKVGDGQCSSFSIHAKQALHITATHCFAAGVEGAIVNDLAKVVKIVETAPGNPMESLTVFQTDLRFEKAGQYPALKLGPRPEPGQDVLNPSYGGDSPRLIFFEGLFLFTAEQVKRDYFTMPLMPGMSGSPVINRRLQVVGVIVGGLQPTDLPTIVPFGPTYDQLASLMAKYGER